MSAGLRLLFVYDGGKSTLGHREDQLLNTLIAAPSRTNPDNQVYGKTGELTSAVPKGRVLVVAGWAAARQHGKALFDQCLRYVHGYARPGEPMARFWALMLYATATETGQEVASITPEQLRYRLPEVSDYRQQDADAVRAWLCVQLQRAGHHATNPEPPSNAIAMTWEHAAAKIRHDLDRLDKLASGQCDDPVVNTWTDYTRSRDTFDAGIAFMIRMLDAGLLAERGGWLHGTMVRTHCHCPLEWSSTIPAYGGRGFVDSPRWRFDHERRTLTDGLPDAYVIIEDPTPTERVQVDRRDLTPASVPEPPEQSPDPAAWTPDPDWCAALECADGLVRTLMGDQHAETWTYQGTVFTIALTLHGLSRRSNTPAAEVPLDAALNVLLSPTGLDDLVHAVVGTETPAWIWLLRWWPRDATRPDDGLRRTYASGTPEPALHLCRNRAIHALELPLLAARGAPTPGALVRTTGGNAPGIEGRVHAWTWNITQDGTLPSGPPHNYAIKPLGVIGRFLQVEPRNLQLMPGTP